METTLHTCRGRTARHRPQAPALQHQEARNGLPAEHEQGTIRVMPHAALATQGLSSGCGQRLPEVHPKG